MTAPGDVKERLVALAKEIGFDACRVAACDPPPHAAQFRQWLHDGRAGEMHYMERGEERRCDPQLVLPGARSVVSLALSYWQGETDEREAGRGREAGSFPYRAERGARGRIARYAWGDDYHGVIEKKLAALDDFLKGTGGVQKCYVDTGPVLERDYAAEAGIGWHGKSTMLLDRRLGTWFFLGEILTTLPLPPDGPQAARCGRCTRCMAACPTGAITDAHQLDARRCISYLTIELKGSIPLEFRPLIGDRIFGCDTCLDVCPWNRFAAAARETALAARPEVTAMKLRDFLALDDAQFRELFRNSPIKRIKRRGFLRNVCVALGNVGTREDLPALEKAAHDHEPLIAEHATWGLAEIEKRVSVMASSEDGSRA